MTLGEPSPSGAFAMDAEKGIVWADREGDHIQLWLDALLLQCQNVRAPKSGLG